MNGTQMERDWHDTTICKLVNVSDVQYEQNTSKTLDFFFSDFPKVPNG